MFGPLVSITLPTTGMRFIIINTSFCVLFEFLNGCLKKIVKSVYEWLLPDMPECKNQHEIIKLVYLRVSYNAVRRSYRLLEMEDHISGFQKCLGLASN